MSYECCVDRSIYLSSYSGIVRGVKCTYVVCLHACVQMPDLRLRIKCASIQRVVDVILQLFFRGYLVRMRGCCELGWNGRVNEYIRYDGSSGDN